MPYKIESLAGQPYRPSNGTEGEMFMSQFCYRCKHDNYTDETPNSGCKLILLSMCNYTDEPNYPAAWTHDEEGEPTCTEFERR